jgi:ABC-2 type transport system permease protein
VLKARRRPLTLWAVSIAAVAALYTAFYPSIGGDKIAVMLQSMPPELITAMGFDSITTAAGYASSTVYSLLGAILTLVCAIGLGAGLNAGQEEDRTLELELSAPVSRPQICLEHLAVLWATVLALTLAVTAVLGALSVLLDLGLSTVNLIAASTSLLLFGGTLGTVAYATGAATGRRATALAVAAAVAVTAYLLNYLGPLVEAP